MPFHEVRHPECNGSEYPEEQVHRAFNATAAEMVRQLRKWGVQGHEDLKWLAILMEEVGELAEAILLPGDRKIPEASDLVKRRQRRHELIQVAAVAISWLSADPLPDLGDSRDERGLY